MVKGEHAKKEVKKELLNLLRKVEGFVYVYVSDIVNDLDIPIRMHDEEEYARLKESIEKEGIIVPLILFKKKGKNEYILVDGRNRLKAARELGLEEVPALIYSYSYEDEDDKLKVEEAKYLAMLLEQARRHLTPTELENVIKNTFLHVQKISTSRQEIYKNVLSSLKLEQIFSAKENKEQMEKQIEEQIQKIKEAYEKEITNKNREIEELKQKIEEYSQQINDLKKSLKALEEKAFTAEAAEDEFLFEDVKYFSVEDDEEERERLIKEAEARAEERLREQYLSQLKEYEKMMKVLKENLEKKENEVRMLNEKLKLVFKRTEEVKKTLSEVVGLNVLFKKIESLFEEAKGINHILFEMVSQGLTYTAEQLKAFYEKWKEVKAYLEHVDKKIEETLVLCNKELPESLENLENNEESLNNFEKQKSKKKKTQQL